MSNSIIFVGLDVDDKAFHGYFISSDGQVNGDFTCKPNINSLCTKLRKIQASAVSLKICYEATYIGFSLCRDLIAKGFSCEVIAPSLVPRVPGAQVKTDRLDSKKLAQFYSQGLLTVVQLPDPEDESIRDLVRTRKFIADQTRATKTHILCLCRRMGLNYRVAAGKSQASFWTRLHMVWLDKQVNQTKYSAHKINLTLLLNQLKSLQLQLNLYENEIEKFANETKYKNKVSSLCCYRGIDVLTAMSVIVEIGNVTRFDHPRRLVSYAGMDLREYSSGGKEKRFSMTKQGNPFLRTTVVQICQTAAEIPKLSTRLVYQRKQTDPKFIEIADRCMARLHKKSYRMQIRGKTTNKIKVACARELIGFVWESLKLAS